MRHGFDAINLLSVILFMSVHGAAANAASYVEYRFAAEVSEVSVDLRYSDAIGDLRDSFSVGDVVTGYLLVEQLAVEPTNLPVQSVRYGVPAYEIHIGNEFTVAGQAHLDVTDFRDELAMLGDSFFIEGDTILTSGAVPQQSDPLSASIYLKFSGDLLNSPIVLDEFPLHEAITAQGSVVFAPSNLVVYQLTSISAVPEANSGVLSGIAAMMLLALCRSHSTGTRP